MERYQHERLARLADGSVSIRLVRIRSGMPEDRVHVAIQQFRLEDVTGPGAPPWHALSYTWGDLKDTEDILVEVHDEVGDGMQTSIQSKSLAVTRLLTEFLRAVRSSKRDCIMWIDAICIDQGEDSVALEERGWQVRSMHEIYSKATGVVIWLGLEADDSSYAIQLLDELGLTFDVNWTTFSVSTLTGEFSAAMDKWANQYGRTTREAQAVWALLGRKYFTRTWVRQEAILANDQASIVQCGSQKMRLDTFRRAMHFLGNFGFEALPLHTPEEIDNRLSSALMISQRTYMDEPNLMYRSRISNCKDDRDKVYGNLGLLRNTADKRFVSSIVVDYKPENNTEKVYLDFFRKHHERYGTLRLLSEAGLCQGSSMEPTWVPDWRTTIRGLDLTMEAASSHFVQAECTFINESILQVLGRSGSVVLARHYLRIDNAHKVSMDWFWELSSILCSLDGPLQPTILAEQMSYAICCAMYTLPQTIETVLGYRPRISAYLQYLCSVFAKSPSDLTPPIDVVGHAGAWALQQGIQYIKLAQLPIILCKHNLVGIGSRRVQEGDVVTTILGSRSLILLRSTDDSRFQVVGPCFVHGLNWGEALLGPLPAKYIVTPQLEPERGVYMPHYKDTDTGETTMLDPRIAWVELEALPSTGDVQVMPKLPNEPHRMRPDSEYLQRHGIKLEKFNLI